MLLQLKPPAQAQGDDPFISVKAINQLVKNFLDYTLKVDTATGSVKKMQYDRDSYSVWFSMDEIKQLLSDNSSEVLKPTGIRVYLGLHSDSDIENEEMPKRPKTYINHHTVVLVATFRNKDGVEEDILHTSDYVLLNAANGLGADEGSISPPPYPIPGSKVTPR